jgi:flavin reductase (DIM6/NTAB) family NADH-FMN oxidoreductase RutF
MIIDPQFLSPHAMHGLVLSTVMPRPIAFISTVSADGVLNLAPFSCFAPVATAPPLLGVSISSRDGQPKDTLRNAREAGEFVVNVVSEELAEKMVQTSGEYPPEVDEFALAGLTPVPSDLVKPPRVGESPVSFECRLERVLEFGENSFVVGQILRVHVRDDVLTAGRVDPMKLRPLGRLGGDAYSLLREIRHIPRPRVEPGPVRRT